MDGVGGARACIRAFPYGESGPLRGEQLHEEIRERNDPVNADHEGCSWIGCPRNPHDPSRGCHEDDPRLYPRVTRTALSTAMVARSSVSFPSLSVRRIVHQIEVCGHEIVFLPVLWG